MSIPFAAKVVICAVGITALGGLGGWLTSGNMGWYQTLEEPPGTPPNWVFGPVWTVLYLLMGVSLALLWQRGGSNRAALVAFAVQLVLNLAWTPVFFGMQRIGAALVIIVCLWLAIVVTIFAARGVSPKAAWLLIPYLVWVSYATYLNTGFLVYN